VVAAVVVESGWSVAGLAGLAGLALLALLARLVLPCPMPHGYQPEPAVRKWHALRLRISLYN
jgi:hypothetical protein